MGGVVDSIFGGGGDDAADAQIYAAQMAAKQFEPYDVTTDIGTVTTSKGAITSKLSPEYRAQLDAEFALAGRDLDAATAERLAMLETFSAQDEADARRFKREELFRAGRSGTYGATREVQAVEEALARARLQRQLSAREMAFNERQNALSNTVAMGQLPVAMGGLSINRTPATIATGFMNAGATSAAFDLARENATRELVFGAASPYINQGVGALGGMIGDIFGGGTSYAVNNALPAFGSTIGSAFSAFAAPAATNLLAASVPTLTGTVASGTAAAAAPGFFAAFSDRRLKKDIEQIKSDGRYPWYRFRFKDPDTYGHGVYIGVMADEVEQINPSAVHDMPNGFKAVDYSRL